MQNLIKLGFRDGLLGNPLADGSGVNIALIDTGVNVSKLQRKFDGNGVKFKTITNALFKSNGVIDYSSIAPPVLPHGTVVADILLNHAPQAQLYSANVFEFRSFTELDLLLHAIHVAIHDWKCKVINLSLGLPEERLQQPWRRLQFLNALEDAYRNDVLVFAAGNNDHPLTRSFPAVFESSLFSVNKKLLDGMLKFKYFPQAGLEFLGHGYADLAPIGSDLETSWATAHLAGTAAKIASLCPTIKPFEMKSILYWVSREWYDQSGSDS
ncbi:MAG: peptidase M1 [Planctomycetota bacterium]|nr:MAG: peptidase M1 [Planctomycetota bacterium]